MISKIGTSCSGMSSTLSEGCSLSDDCSTITCNMDFVEKPITFKLKVFIAIAIFTVNFSHLNYKVIESGFEAISGHFAVSALNFLTSTFEYTVVQMRKVNCEKGYSLGFTTL